MKKIGITGGIGSGKTTVTKIFKALGIPVYYADDRAKAMMTNNAGLVNQIKEIFGEEAYHKDGSLNRGHLSSIVFKDKEKLKKLEGVVHPAVRKDGNDWHNSQQNVPYTLKEAALFVENGGYKLMDKMIMVFTPKELRIERVMKRDDLPREAVEARINAQMADEEKMKFCDFVIYNNGEKSLVKQVLEIHRAID